MAAKTKKRILINGYFLCRPVTGIERYAFEITKRLDGLCRPGEIAIIIPAGAENVPSYKNIEIIIYGKKRRQMYWQMITLQCFLLKHRNFIVLDFGNTCLPLAPGIVFLHDIYCALYPEDFKSFRDKLAVLYNKWQYLLTARKAKKIVTVSEYSRKQIAQTYHIDEGRISVVYSSWNHFRDIKADYSIFDELPELKTRPFYFSLGSISKRKNIKWIFEYASRHSSDLFVLSGSNLGTAEDRDLQSGNTPPNIIFAGFLSDEKIRALFERCKAFLLPSYYEGFGLTPLEALSCGAKIVIANAASLPEIFGKTAHYIDPNDSNVDLDKLLEEPVEDPAAILEKYSYDKSAEKVYAIMLGVGSWELGVGL